MTPDALVRFLGDAGASAILRTGLAEAAEPAMEAALRGGFRVIEFTLTTPGALELIRRFARRDGIAVGAGTVLTVDQARAAADAGAVFLVSPVVDEAVIEAGHDLGVAVVPGTHTPTEMLRAHRAGARLQKLFPAPAGGPAYVAACLGPMPFLRLVPTNGVDEANAAGFLRAGSFALGFVSPVFNPDDLAHGRFAHVEARARTILAAVADARRDIPAPA
jgi:Entner-Doudoroff aldolase